MPRVQFSDKFAHAFVYFVLTLLLARAWLKQDHKVVWRNRAFLLAFILSMVLGGVLELVQHYIIEGRRGELLDIAANLGGALMAYPMHRLLRGGSFT
ncbi:MAG: VanZ family protein [Flavobacteriales bacterium]|nr:VanZ family protein [Flavobacteriales bacterium]